MFKNFAYVSHQGNHFPDARVGDSLLYSVEFTSTEDLEEMSDITFQWSSPSGAEVAHVRQVQNEVTATIKSSRVGTHTISCNVSFKKDNVMQTLKLNMLLTVY